MLSARLAARRRPRAVGKDNGGENKRRAVQQSRARSGRSDRTAARPERGGDRGLRDGPAGLQHQVGACADPARSGSPGNGPGAAGVVCPVPGRAVVAVAVLRRADPDPRHRLAEDLGRPAAVPGDHRRGAARVPGGGAAGAGHLERIRQRRLGHRTASQQRGLPESWPTVRVRTAGDAPAVAKILPDAAALRAERSLLTTYERGAAQQTALTLRRGGSVTVDLLAAGGSTRSCRRLTSVTIYPSAGALGAGRAVRVAAPVRICGAPRILSFLPGREGEGAMTIAHGALHRSEETRLNSSHTV